MCGELTCSYESTDLHLCVYQDGLSTCLLQLDDEE
uniref:Uncharacterized protein n=1 Tax=Dunaliella salina TaxID=3046 RepID=L7Z825_DUNSA|nr:hypothetical protein [Dunaliella salina]